MSPPRLYVSETLAEGQSIRLGEAAAHYLTHVLRLPAGAPVRAFNGRDGEFAATLERPGKQAAALVLQARQRAPAPEADLWLVFAPLKRAATDLVVEKATELGVTAILPVFTTYTGAERVRLERWEAIAREAAEQCERLSVPALHPPVTLPQLLAAWPAPRPLLACLARDPGAQSVAHALSDGPPGAGLLIGPEGGFDPREEAALRAHGAVRGVTLGPRILRAETAVIAGLALIQAAWGDKPAPASP